MRNLVFIFFLMMSMSTYAQNHENSGKPYEVYCQICGQLQASGKILYKRIIWPESEKRTKLTDENGKILEFKNITEAMTYLGKKGWKYVDNSTYSDMIFYIFKKSVHSAEDAKAGLYFLEDFN